MERTPLSKNSVLYFAHEGDILNCVVVQIEHSYMHIICEGIHAKRKLSLVGDKFFTNYADAKRVLEIDSVKFDSKGIDKNGKTWDEYARNLPDGAEHKIWKHRCTNEGIVLTCEDCQKLFLFTFGEYEYYLKKGFKPPFPKRCPECRDEKKRNEKYLGLNEAFNNPHVRKETGREQSFRRTVPISERHDTGGMNNRSWEEIEKYDNKFDKEKR